MIFTLITIITLFALVIASYSDIKTREVSDWLNYGLIFTGLGIRLIYSSITFDWMFLVYGVVGFLVFLLLALIMFYTGQWGGGDSKLLMGIGALFGLEFKVDSLLLTFLINLLFAGAIYGFAYSLILAYKNRKKFTKELEKLSFLVRNLKLVFLLVFFVLLLLVVFIGDFRTKLMLSLAALLLYFSFYMWLFVKAVENSCMYKFVAPAKLTEGDWIAKTVKVKGKYICGPNDLGIEKHQIEKLIKLKIRKILIKEGIPFVPSFLFGYLVTLFWGNWWIWLI